jgi:hypothetical protein
VTDHDDRSADDRALAAQLGRPLKAPADVVVRCHLGLPVVSSVPEQLKDGTPFPTSFWLTCPLARRRVGRLEGRGAVREWDEKIAADGELRAEMDAAQAAYPSGRGVGGTTSSVKCLHAHAGYALAGGATPPGRWAVEQISPLECERPCVVDGEPNEGWRPKPE